MTQDQTILVSWSGGKDSAFALHELRKTYIGNIELFTTLNMVNGRIAMHGVSEQLLDKQAESIGLPLHKIYIPDSCSNDEYSIRMAEFMNSMKLRGIDTIVFGDLFLEDIRKYREENLQKLNMKALFPMWGIPTANVALRYIQIGFKAVLSCVDTQVLDKEFSGKEYNLDLIGKMPVNVDPCGENGEFHSFVFDGPVFSFPISWEKGEQLLKYDRFFYTDLILR